jgi:3',5'-cyclic AMP phosphodiesterase CpdA
MAIFSLIHASDFHIGSRPDFINGYDIGSFRGWFKQAFSREISGSLTPSTFWPDVASRFTHDMDQQTDDIDAIVLTGDIATTGSSSDINAAAGFIRGKVPPNWVSSSRAFRPLLSNALPPIILMPGNHDRYTPPALTPQSLEFEKAFGKQWDLGQFPSNGISNNRFAHSFALRKDGCALVLCTVDFSLPALSDSTSSFGFLGQGIVKTQRRTPYANFSPLDELIDQTRWAQENEENCSVVWCVHFPPKFPGITNEMQLIDEHYLLAAAEELGIKLILSGHTHEYNTYLIGPSTRVVCCGTTTAKSTGGGHQYLRLDIDTNDLANPNIVPKTYDFDLSMFV